MMQTLLVANRGEIAVRVLRAARTVGLRTVAVYSEADASALHVTEADTAIAIGPAKAADSYLRIEAILSAAQQAGADAIHPGYGFLAENAAFARTVEAAGLTFVGPTPDQIDAMGDKERARHAAQAAGVPVLPASERLEPGAHADIHAAAETVGYPLLVKAAAGGGGIGMRLVETPDTLAATVTATQAMAARAFGNGSVYLEHYISRARHVEVQVFGLGDGRAAHLFERECSIQRRFQKIIEESPSPGLTETTRAAMCEAAVALARAVSYRSAGTVEFVVNADTGQFFFLEMNTRIQVEHPVTEMRTGIDLVALQLRLARGEIIWPELQDATATGHAIEVRLCAENPDKLFLPSAACAEAGRQENIDPVTIAATKPIFNLFTLISCNPFSRSRAARKLRSLHRSDRLQVLCHGIRLILSQAEEPWPIRLPDDPNQRRQVRIIKSYNNYVAYLSILHWTAALHACD